MTCISIDGNEIREEWHPVIWTASMWPRWHSGTLFEVKQKAKPLPWQDMNHWGEAALVLVWQQLWGEMSMLVCVCKGSTTESHPLPLNQKRLSPKFCTSLHSPPHAVTDLSVTSIMTCWMAKTKISITGWPPCICHQCCNQLAFIKVGFDRSLM